MMTAETTAAAMPPAVAESPPVRTPSQPSSATALATPLARAWPKPVRGTVAPVGQGLVQPHGAENDARHHIACQDAGGGQLGAVDEELPDGAEDAAAEKRVEIFHMPYLSVLTHTRWQMPGMDSP